MGIGSLLMGAALALVVALYVGRPFLKGQLERQEALSAREALLAQKEALLHRIRALDFEYETGKMPDGEYHRQRAYFMQEAATVLKELDSLAAGEQGKGAAQPIPRDVETDVEAAIAAARTAPAAAQMSEAQPSDGAAQKAAEIEAAVRQLRGAASANGDAQPAVSLPASPKPPAPQAAGRFCSQCGNPRDPGDKFCAYCGFRFA